MPHVQHDVCTKRSLHTAKPSRRRRRLPRPGKAAVLSSRIRSFETRSEQVRTRSDLFKCIGLVFKPRVLTSFYVMRRGTDGGNGGRTRYQLWLCWSCNTVMEAVMETPAAPPDRGCGHGMYEYIVEALVCIRVFFVVVRGCPRRLAAEAVDYWSLLGSALAFLWLAHT